MPATGLVVALVGGKANTLWASHDGGASWHQAAARGWDQGRPTIVANSTGHDTLFAPGAHGVQRSDDGGETWQTVASGNSTGATALPTYPSDGTVAVVGTSDFLLSAHGRKSVTGSGGKYTDYSFYFAPDYPSTGRRPVALLSAIDGHGMPVVQQCNASLACSGGSPLPGSVTYSAPVALMPSTTYAADGVVFAQTGRGIYKSADGGVSFSPLPVAAADGASITTTPMLALAPGYKESGPVRTLYVAVFETFADPRAPHTGGGVFRSDDGGTTWRKVGSPSPLDSGAVSVAVASDGRLFAGYLYTSPAGTGEGLLCSTDGGAHWSANCPADGSSRNDPGLPVTAGRDAGGAHSGLTSGSTANIAGGAPGTSPLPGSTDRQPGQQPASGGSLGAETGTGAHGRTFPVALVIAGLMVALAIGGGVAWRRRRAEAPAGG